MRLDKKTENELNMMFRNPELTPYMRHKIWEELDKR